MFNDICFIMKQIELKKKIKNYLLSYNNFIIGNKLLLKELEKFLNNSDIPSIKNKDKNSIFFDKIKKTLIRGKSNKIKTLEDLLKERK